MSLAVVFHGGVKKVIHAYSLEECTISMLGIVDHHRSRNSCLCVTKLHLKSIL